MRVFTAPLNQLETTGKQNHDSGLMPIARIYNVDTNLYLLHKTLLNEKPDTDTIKALYRANLSMAETREVLKNGRSNIPDSYSDEAKAVDPFKPHIDTIRQRGYIAEYVCKNKIRDRCMINATEAAVAMVAKTGNCSEFSAVLQAQHAKKLKMNEQLYRVNGRGFDHEWVELQTSKESTEDKYKISIVMDSWAYGPAILHEDSHIADSVKHRFRSDVIRSPKEGQDHNEKVMAKKQSIENGATLAFGLTLEELLVTPTSNGKRGLRVRQKMDTISESFLNRVQDAPTKSEKVLRRLNVTDENDTSKAERAALMSEIRKAGILRDTIDLSVRKSTNKDTLEDMFCTSKRPSK
ncbi:hypothetical protein [Vibrio aquimaris]|uniref:Uncharacterized protein n=1 Tax=Vibrio aquimaris TaxID=2587862 RepID=A0A5P9CPF9_9VIBR|nr:hypothetical protein [Vibrio aquimaris]QFT27861.1 hypothetical protein FIV01_15840 [Vibrio aquimaris]